jgi:hypothetical protein
VSTQLPLPLAQTAKKAKGASDPRWTFYAKPRHNAQFWDVQTPAVRRGRQPDEGHYNLVLGKGLIGDGVPYPNIRDARDLRRNRQSLLKNSGATNGPCSSLQICLKSRKWQLTRAEAASNAQVVTNRCSGSPLGTGNRYCRGRTTWLSNEFVHTGLCRHENILSLALGRFACFPACLPN